MGFIITIIMTILVYQTINFVVYLCTKENEDALLASSAGLFVLFSILYRKIYDEKRNWQYKSLLKDKNGNLCYCKPKYTDYLLNLENENYQFPIEIRDKYKVSDGWEERLCSFAGVNLRYTPNKVIKSEGAYKVPKSIIKNAKYKAKEG